MGFCFVFVVVFACVFSGAFWLLTSSLADFSWMGGGGDREREAMGWGIVWMYGGVEGGGTCVFAGRGVEIYIYIYIYIYRERERERERERG